MDRPHLTAQRVSDLANRHRVARDPKYHAREHHVDFPTVVAALSECHRVFPDERRDEAGRLRHPLGYLAWCFLEGRRQLRVDFNFAETEGGALILVVTAMEI